MSWGQNFYFFDYTFNLLSSSSVSTTHHLVSALGYGRLTVLAGPYELEVLEVIVIVTTWVTTEVGP